MATRETAVERAAFGSDGGVRLPSLPSPRRLAGLVVPLLLLAGWQLAVNAGIYSTAQLPAPLDVVAALRDTGFRTVTVVARNAETGPALARTYGFEWLPELGAAHPQLLVNATPVGMAGGAESEALPFPEDAVHAAEAVFDVVAMPAETPMIRLATAAGKTVITGAEVIALQAAEQFTLYTGVRPTDEQIRHASEFSRAPSKA